MSTPLVIDSDRLQREIDELAAISEAPSPAVTRILFSETDLAARSWLLEQCEQLGLAVRLDAVGNIFARWVGTEPQLPAIATGSHIDAIPNAGRYDGVLGVLGPLEAFRALRLQGFVPRRSIELITFTAEEPTRFGLGCLGSRLMSGSLSPEKALALKDSSGKTLELWLAEMNWPKAPLESVKLPLNFYRAFVELHIEQGPILEKEELDLGVVEKIAAPSSFRVRFLGQGGHAGGVLMPARRDALSGACELALEIEAAALTSGSLDTVATTGVIKSEPNAINSIPFRVLMEVDLRDTDLAARTLTYERIHTKAVEIAQRRQLEMVWEPINMDPPAISESELVHSLHRHAEASGKKVRKMISRAYHDCLFMAQICPTTMLFIPCKGGMSHRPDEFSSKAQMAHGVEILAKALAEWSTELE